MSEYELDEKSFHLRELSVSLLGLGNHTSFKLQV